MASLSGESWMREYNEAAKLADDMGGMISKKSSMAASGPDSQRHFSSVRRKITILGTRLDSLESLLAKLPSKQAIERDEPPTGHAFEFEIKNKSDGIHFEHVKFCQQRRFTWSVINTVDVMSRTAGLDDQGIVSLQRQIMREQDEGLEKLEETVISTKHIALAVNEELDLQTRLLDSLDYQVDVTGSRLQRIQRTLATLNKRTKGGCSCACLLLSVAGIVILVLVAWVLIKYL